MLKTERGAPDGIHIVTFHEGSQYDEGEFGGDLCAVFLRERFMTPVVDRESEGDMMGEKALPGPSEKQAFTSSPNNKSEKEREKPRDDKPKRVYARRPR